MRRFFPVIFCILCATVSTSIFVLEMRPFLRPSPRELPFYWFLSSRDNNYALSEYSKTRILKDCNLGLSSPIGRALPSDTYRQIALRCAELSELIIKTMPTYGLAWHMLAKTKLVLGDRLAFESAFLQSWIVSPHERWLAQERLMLVASNGSENDDTIRPAIKSDIRALLQTNSGFLFVLDLYRRDVGFRDGVTEVLEAMPGDIQRRFLFRLQSPSPADSSGRVPDGTPSTQGKTVTSS